MTSRAHLRWCGALVYGCDCGYERGLLEAAREVVDPQPGRVSVDSVDALNLRAAVEAAPDPAPLDVERLAQAILDNIEFDEDTQGESCRYCMETWRKRHPHAKDCVVRIARMYVKEQS